MAICLDVGGATFDFFDTISVDEFPSFDVFLLENAAFQPKECLSVTEGGTMSERFIDEVMREEDFERMEREALERRELVETADSLLLEIGKGIKPMGEALQIHVNPHTSSITISPVGTLASGGSNISFIADLFDDGFPWHMTDRAMTVIKRNGTEAPFDIAKIAKSIWKANKTVEESIRMTPAQILRIAERVTLNCDKMGRTPSVEEIQDLVECQIMAHGAYEVAKNYVTYRYIMHSLSRESHDTDKKIASLIQSCKEEAAQENSNKNPITLYAKEKPLTFLAWSWPPTNSVMMKAQREALIRFLDIDRYTQSTDNYRFFGVEDTEDMLRNGTVIMGTLIERPHGFSTAYDIFQRTFEQANSDQIRRGEFSEPVRRFEMRNYVDLQKISETIRKQPLKIDAGFLGRRTTRLLETARLELEALLLKIKRDAQKIQYRPFTRLMTNQQTLYDSIHIPERTADFALIIKKTLEQRYQGVKSESGAWASPDGSKFLYAPQGKSTLINARLDMRMSASERLDDGFPWHTTDCAMNVLSAGDCFPYPVSYLKRAELTEDWKGISEICTRPLKRDNFKWRDIILVWVFQSETESESAPIFHDDKSVSPRRTLWDCNSASVSVTVWLPNMMEGWKNRDFQESPLTFSLIDGSFTGNIAQ